MRDEERRDVERRAASGDDRARVELLSARLDDASAPGGRIAAWLAADAAARILWLRDVADVAGPRWTVGDLVRSDAARRKALERLARDEHESLASRSVFAREVWVVGRVVRVVEAARAARVGIRIDSRGREGRVAVHFEAAVPVLVVDEPSRARQVDWRRWPPSAPEMAEPVMNVVPRGDAGGQLRTWRWMMRGTRLGLMGEVEPAPFSSF